MSLANKFAKKAGGYDGFPATDRVVTGLASNPPDGYFVAMSMHEILRDHLKLSPFQSFTVRTADGREYPVPTIDHVYLPPGSNLVFITDDRGVTVGIPALLITGFVRESTVDEQPS